MMFRNLALFRCFSTTATSEAVQSIAGHKPPAFTDAPSGRYAGSLFTAASKSSALQTVLSDLLHLREVIKETPSFRETLKNSSIRRGVQKQIFATFAPQNYHQLTLNFLNTLVDAGRLSELEKIIDTYVKYCKILNKQEDIRVISAVQLTQEQKDKVVASLKKNKPGVSFKVTYEVEPAILGGLQLFAGSEFLDLSLRSRIQRLKSQLNRIA